MSKKLELLLPVTILLALILIACQKEKQEIIKPQPSLQQTASRMNFSLNIASTKCRISLDSAVAYTTAFREHMETIEGKEAGKYTIAYSIPADGLLDLFTTAEQEGTKLKAIRAYRAIRNGKETLVYIGVDENDNDLIPNNNITNYDHPKTAPVEDQVGLLLSGTTTSNSLNSK